MVLPIPSYQVTQKYITEIDRLMASPSLKIRITACVFTLVCFKAFSLVNWPDWEPESQAGSLSHVLVFHLCYFRF